MFFEDKRIVYYRRTCAKIRKQLSPLSFYKKKKIDAEIAAFVFVVFDVIVMLNESDRYEFMDLIMPEVQAFSEKKEAYILKRIDFYGEFMRGKEPRGDYLFDDIDKLFKSRDGLLKTILAFGDIVFDTNKIKEYDNAPWRIRDIFETVEFTKIMMNDISKTIVKAGDHIDAIYKNLNNK